MGRSVAARTGEGVFWDPRRGGRAAEGAPLLREYRLIPYRGFESLPLRQNFRLEGIGAARLGRRGSSGAFQEEKDCVSRLMGEMAERLKAHAWKACVGQPTVGSNPTLSAISSGLVGACFRAARRRPGANPRALSNDAAKGRRACAFGFEPGRHASRSSGVFARARWPGDPLRVERTS